MFHYSVCQTSLLVLALRLFKPHLLSVQRGFLLFVETYFTEHLQSLGGRLRARGLIPALLPTPEPRDLIQGASIPLSISQKKEEEIWNNFSGLTHTYHPRLILPAQLAVLTEKNLLSPVTQLNTA